MWAPEKKRKTKRGGSDFEKEFDGTHVEIPYAVSPLTPSDRVQRVICFPPEEGQIPQLAWMRPCREFRARCIKGEREKKNKQKHSPFLS